MRKLLALFFMLSIISSNTHAQTSFELLTSFGLTFTPAITYQNCTGHFSQTVTPLISFIYHPHPSWGLELTYSNTHPTTYLNDPADGSVSVYTHSKINVYRLLTGINYSLPFKKIQPYIGCLAGFTHTVTTQTQLNAIGTCTSFSWAFQTGVDFYFSSYIGLRLNGVLVNSPNISNNSAWYNVDKNGEGFPTYAVGNPSSANITQWDISLGIIVRFMKNKE
jgi:outer membrane protein W